MRARCAVSRQQQSGVVIANLLETQVSFIAVDLIIYMFEDNDFGGGSLTPQFPDQGLIPSPNSEAPSPNHWTTRELPIIYIF